MVVQTFPEFVWQTGRVFHWENISYFRSFRMFHCNSGTDVLWICLKKSSGWRPDVSHSDKISLKSWIEENLRITSASFYSREDLKGETLQSKRSAKNRRFFWEKDFSEFCRDFSHSEGNMRLRRTYECESKIWEKLLQIVLNKKADNN